MRWYFEGSDQGIFDILGYTTDEGGAFLAEGTDGSQFDYLFPNGDDLRLIARPIEDMTDEEKQELFDRVFKDWKDDSRFTNMDCESIIRDFIEGFLYALEIGVYPFSDKSDVEFQPKRDSDE